jgi:predicted  nucleic acid-binding Zn-ribbon protein
MKRIFVLLMLVITPFVFSLDKAAAIRALEKEQALAEKYQKRLTANEEIIKKLSNDEKMKDYKKRLAQLRSRKYVLEYTIKNTRIAKERERLVPEFDAAAGEYADLLHEYETFVAGLN